MDRTTRIVSDRVVILVGLFSQLHILNNITLITIAVLVFSYRVTKNDAIYLLDCAEQTSSAI